MNRQSLAQAEAALEWELAEKAALQVQIEEMSNLMANFKAMHHLDGKE